jgi:phosphoribosylglycinamide formyltransferase 2
MSSSGKGQSFIRTLTSWLRPGAMRSRAAAPADGLSSRVVNFDFEITLLTVSAVDGVHFCAVGIARKMAIIANPGSRSR